MRSAGGRPDLDVTIFEQLVGRARDAPDSERALELADEALALWRDEPYVEFGDVPHFLGETDGREHARAA